MPSPRIIIMGHLSREGVPQQIEQLRDWFSRRVEVAWIGSTHDQPPPLEGAVLCVVFGGDGTILAAARALVGRNLPLLGVNMGKLGFLAEFNVEHLQKHFDDILAGKVQPTRHMLLQMCVRSSQGKPFSSPVANDVAISAGPPFRMIHLMLSQGGRPIVQYHGDGLIVSTPTGSTAYNMSAGGPIMEPTLEAIALTPIAPHSLTIRPIVVRSDRLLNIAAVKVNPGTMAIVDGQLSAPLCEGDQVTISRLEQDLLIVPHPGRTFFQTLTGKLQWGRSPHESPDARPAGG
jgi:NAD+ kinase